MAKIGISEFSAKNNVCPCVYLITMNTENPKVSRESFIGFAVGKKILKCLLCPA